MSGNDMGSFFAVCGCERGLEKKKVRFCLQILFISFLGKKEDHQQNKSEGGTRSWGLYIVLEEICFSVALPIKTRRWEICSSADPAVWFEAEIGGGQGRGVLTDSQPQKSIVGLV